MCAASGVGPSSRRHPSAIAVPLVVINFTPAILSVSRESYNIQKLITYDRCLS